MQVFEEWLQERGYRLDLGVSGKFQPIVDMLFPRRESYIYRVLGVGG